MKRNFLTILVGVLLLLIFVLLLFTFQVRQTEVAVVTTFDRPTRPIEEPGLKWKWPVPIQKVFKFDKRIHNFEGKFQETLTRDNLQILVLVYAGWTIRDPQVFFNSFPSGKTSDAQPQLEGIIQSAKTAVVGKHNFADFVSSRNEELKLDQIEKEILQAAQSTALKNYGIEINFLRIKRIGLPESVTQKVFDRMQAERRSEVESLNAQGEAEAINIRTTAERDRDIILSQADSAATEIRGQADAEAAKAFTVYKENPELAILLMELEVLENASKERATLIFDERMIGFNRLTPRPAAPAETAKQPDVSPQDPKSTILGDTTSTSNGSTSSQ